MVNRWGELVLAAVLAVAIRFSVGAGMAAMQARSGAHLAGTAVVVVAVPTVSLALLVVAAASKFWTLEHKYEQIRTTIRQYHCHRHRIRD